MADLGNYPLIYLPTFSLFHLISLSFHLSPSLFFSWISLVTIFSFEGRPLFFGEDLGIFPSSFFTSKISFLLENSQHAYWVPISSSSFSLWGSLWKKSEEREISTRMRRKQILNMMKSQLRNFCWYMIWRQGNWVWKSHPLGILGPNLSFGIPNFSICTIPLHWWKNVKKN